MTKNSLVAEATYISVAIYTKLMNLIIFGYTQTKIPKSFVIVAQIKKRNKQKHQLL